MTDRELLENAAKAAGYDFAWYCRGANNPNGIPNVPFANGSEWNPLTDDGDALRLAVKLAMELDTGYSDKFVQARTPGCEWFEAVIASSAESATRRAIVRAAAEIGKDMK
jgi:hypothetical protein